MAGHTTAYIGLGSNLGERETSIQIAVKMLAETESIKVVRVSEIIETSPLGRMNQPPYLNAAVEIETSLNTRQREKRKMGLSNY